MGRSNASAPSSLDAAAAMASTSDSQVWGFPAATLNSTQAMVLLLARELRVQDALDVVAAIRTRGMPAADEVPFGLVVSSPLAPDKPLTVRFDCVFICARECAGTIVYSKKRSSTSIQLMFEAVGWHSFERYDGVLVFIHVYVSS